MNKLIITGGLGFIGSNTAAHFLDLGWQVIILDNYSRKGVEFNEAWLRAHSNAVNLCIINYDVRHPASPDIINQLASARALIHLAAQVAVTSSVLDPRTDFEVNALGTFNLLELCRRHNHDIAFIHASTNKVYGDLGDLELQELDTRYAVLNSNFSGVSEAQPLDFHSPYGCSKGSADQYVRDYARIYGLKTVVMRQSCIYGQRQLGVEDQGWVAWFMIAALLGRPVTIYGNGKQVRDLLYVTDLIRAYEAALTRIDNVSGELFNLGGGSSNAVSIYFELRPLFESLNLSYPKTTFSTLRPGDQPLFISDNGHAWKLLGWQPEVSVAQGLSLLADFLRANLDQISDLYAKA